MKSARHLLFFMLLLPTWPACSGGAGGTASVYPKKIIPLAEGGGLSPALSLQNDYGTESYLQTPKIPLSYDEKLVRALTANLDADEANEQVIIIKGPEGDAAPLSLIIADADAQSGYVRSWMTTVGVLDERTIRIAVKDVIGNHSFQVVISGMTRTNQAYLGVWKTASQAAGRLTYTPIFTLASDVSVEIEESDRGVGYSEGYASGSSFPIIVFSHDPDASDVSSIIRDTYNFSYAANTYTLSRHETVKVDKAATDKLAALLHNSSPEILSRYLQGIWYKADETDPNDRKYLTISPETNEIAFYAKDVQEVYSWKYLRRSLFNTLHIYAESELLKSVQPNITAVLASPTELTIEITEYSAMEQWLNEQWGGTYIKRGGVQSGTSGGEKTSFDASLLEGEYASQTGVKAVFNHPSFIWREDGAVYSGGFCVMKVGDGDTNRYLLSLKLIADQGLTVNDKFYTLELSSAPRTGAPAHSFILKPAQTTVYGIVTLKGQPLVFNRIIR